MSTEEVIKFNPEFIIASICGMKDNFPVEWIAKRQGWENLDAVKRGNIFVFDDSYLNRPAPRLVIGLEIDCQSHSY